MNGPLKSRRVFHRFSGDEDVDRELQAHLDLCVDELVREGWDPNDAREEAEARFGNRTRIAEECGAVSRGHRRAVRRGAMIDNVLQDLRYAFRGLKRKPVFIGAMFRATKPCSSCSRALPDSNNNTISISIVFLFMTFPPLNRSLLLPLTAAFSLS